MNSSNLNFIKVSNKIDKSHYPDDNFHFEEDHVTVYKDSRTNEETVGVCELTGQRGFKRGAKLKNAQEDTFIVESGDFASEYSQLPIEQKEDKIQEVFQSIDEEILNSDEEINSGSTAIITSGQIIKEDNKQKIVVDTALLGDSAAYIVIRGKDGSIQVHPCVKNLHDLDNKSEVKRVKDSGGFVLTDKSGVKRVMGQLAVTRAVGDIENKVVKQMLIDSKSTPTTLDDNLILSNRPEVTRTKMELEPGEQAFILTMCDGFLELNYAQNKGDPVIFCQKLKEILTDPSVNASKKLEKKQLGDLSKSLAMYALDYGSQDNLSMIVTEITDKPKVTAVFDGHGGKHVSGLLQKQFVPRMIKSMNIKLDDENKHEAELRNNREELKLNQDLVKTPKPKQDFDYKPVNNFEELKNPSIDVFIENLSIIEKLKELPTNNLSSVLNAIDGNDNAGSYRQKLNDIYINLIANNSNLDYKDLYKLLSSETVDSESIVKLIEFNNKVTEVLKDEVKNYELNNPVLKEKGFFSKLLDSIVNVIYSIFAPDKLKSKLAQEKEQVESAKSVITSFSKNSVNSDSILNRMREINNNDKNGLNGDSVNLSKPKIILSSNDVENKKQQSNNLGDNKSSKDNKPSI